MKASVTGNTNHGIWGTVSGEGNWFLRGCSGNCSKNCKTIHVLAETRHGFFRNQIPIFTARGALFDELEMCKGTIATLAWSHWRKPQKIFQYKHQSCRDSNRNFLYISPTFHRKSWPISELGWRGWHFRAMQCYCYCTIKEDTRGRLAWTESSTTRIPVYIKDSIKSWACLTQHLPRLEYHPSITCMSICLYPEGTSTHTLDDTIYH